VEIFVDRERRHYSRFRNCWTLRFWKTNEASICMFFAILDESNCSKHHEGVPEPLWKPRHSNGLEFLRLEMYPKYFSQLRKNIFLDIKKKFFEKNQCFKKKSDILNFRSGENVDFPKWWKKSTQIFFQKYFLMMSIFLWVAKKKSIQLRRKISSLFDWC